MSLKLWLKGLIKPLIYRFPPMMIAPERLYVWLDTLIKTTEVEGDVIEVGCYLGGTAAVSKHMMERLGMTREYIVVDTFSGFTPEQWKVDADLGTSSERKDHFADNSPKLTRWVLDRHNGKKVRIVQGDIAAIPDHLLPKQISACLLDVDLADPIEKGLHRLYPLLQPGGIIIVDDCGFPVYQARIGYAKFCAAQSLPEEYHYGMGIVRRPAR